VKNINPFSQYIGLSWQVYMLIIARTINSLGDFAYSLITLYLTLKLNLTVLQTGFYLTLAAATTGPGSLVGGYLSDKIGRKKIIIYGQILSATMVFGTIIFINTITVAYLLILSIFFMSLTRPGYVAMLADLTSTEKERKSAFSLLYIGINIGAAIGPFLAGLFFQKYIEGVLLGIGLSTLLSSLLVLNFVKESRMLRQVITTNAGSPNLISMLSKSFGVFFESPLLLIFMLLSVLNFFIYFQYSYSMPIQINNIFNERGPAIYGSLMTINSITVLVITPFVNHLTTKIPSLLTIASGALFYGIGFGVIFYSHDFTMSVVSTIIWTIGEIMVFTNINVHIAQRSPVSFRGRFNGLLLCIGSLGFSLGSYLIGKYITYFNIKLVGPLIFIVGLIYAILMCMLYVVEKVNMDKLHIKSLIKIPREKES
jgi:MFS family permease